MSARDLDVPSPVHPAVGRRFNGIVVPLDLGPVGDRALPTARVLAGRSALPVHFATTTSPGLDDTEDRAQMVRRALELDATYVQLHVEHTNDVTAGLRAAIDEVGMPLVCAATHGRSAIGEFVLGSPIDELLRRSRVPAVLVGPQASPGRVPMTLAVCVDPSGASPDLIRVALAWHEVFGGDLRAVEVVELSSRVEPTPAKELVDAARELRAPFRMLPGSDPAQSLVDLTLERDVVLAMGSHLRHGLARALLGSVAIDVVRRSATPVLIVPCE